MPNVLAIVPGTPTALQGRSILGERFTIDVRADDGAALAEAAQAAQDLLVLANCSPERQQALAAYFQEHRRWRLVPVLYVASADATGFVIPGGFRPEIDGLARGALDTPSVQRRIRELARDGVSAAELVVAGDFELDQLRGRLRFSDIEIVLTEREAEILSILLTHADRTVAADEIIERGWGATTDERYLQILRRHVSNIRRKLSRTPAAEAVCTIRGAGYRFDVRGA